MTHNLVDLEPTVRYESTQTKYGSHLDVSLPGGGSHAINKGDGIIGRRNNCKCFVAHTGFGEMTCIV